MIVDHGLDPQAMPLVVGGGAGPVHAAAIAMELGISEVIVPPECAVFCAVGMLFADLKHELVRSYCVSSDKLDPERWQGLFQVMATEGRDTLLSERAEPEHQRRSSTLRRRSAGPRSKPDCRQKIRRTRGCRRWPHGTHRRTERGGRDAVSRPPCRRVRARLSSAVWPTRSSSVAQAAVAARRRSPRPDHCRACRLASPQFAPQFASLLAAWSRARRVPR